MSSAYIKSQAHAGWVQVKARYDDGGFSGGSTDRPALQSLLEDIRARKVDVIVVYKVDRLMRSFADFAKLVELFDAHDVSFVSVTQQFNTTTSMERLTLNPGNPRENGVFAQAGEMSGLRRLDSGPSKDQTGCSPTQSTNLSQETNFGQGNTKMEISGNRSLDRPPIRYAPRSDVNPPSDLYRFLHQAWPPHVHLKDTTPLCTKLVMSPSSKPDSRSTVAPSAPIGESGRVGRRANPAN